MEINRMIRNFIPEKWDSLSTNDKLKTCKYFCEQYIRDLQGTYKTSLYGHEISFDISGLNINFNFQFEKFSDTTGAEFDKKTNTILINQYTFDDKRNPGNSSMLLFYLTHEIQHAIQNHIIQQPVCAYENAYQQEYCFLLKAHLDLDTIQCLNAEKNISLFYVPLEIADTDAKNQTLAIYALSLPEREAFLKAEEFGNQMLDQLSIRQSASYATLSEAYDVMWDDFQCKRENVDSFYDSAIKRIVQGVGPDKFYEAKLQFMLVATANSLYNLRQAEILPTNEYINFEKQEMMKLTYLLDIAEDFVLSKGIEKPIPTIGTFEKLEALQDVQKFSQLDPRVVQNNGDLLIEGYHQEFLSIEELAGADKADKIKEYLKTHDIPNGIVSYSNKEEFIEEYESYYGIGTLNLDDREP